MTDLGRRIVVGVDDSPESRLALHWTVAEARYRGLPVRVVRAYEWPSPPPLVNEDVHERFPPPPGEAGFEEALTYVRDRLGVSRASGVFASGRPARVLLDEAYEAELLVVGSRSLSAMASIVLGSVSSAVAARAACPVIVVRKGTADSPRPRIVVGVDGSELSERAIGFAFEEASQHGLPLSVVHCWQQYEYAHPADWTEENSAARRDQHLLWVSHSISGYRDKYPDVQVAVHVLEGRPAVVLAAQSKGAHLLVVGSRGRGGVTGLLLGSVSQALLHHAHCSVAVVRSVGPDTSAEAP